jgi:hypothetical protein
MMLFLLSFIGLFLLSTFTLVTPSVSAAAGKNSTMSPSGEQERSIIILQQGTFNLDQPLDNLPDQNYIFTLGVSGNYTLNNNSSDKTLTINNDSFSGTLFGIENLAAMHEPQIRMRLYNINNISVSANFKILNYNETFVDEKNANLTSSVAGTMEFQNPIAFDKVLDRQEAIPESSMKLILEATLLNPLKSSPGTGIEINEISIS